MLLDVTNRDVHKNEQSLEEIMADLYEELGQNAANHDKPLGVLTGFPRIDECLLGMRPGQMIVIGARPGVGKTSFALNLMTNAAFNGASVAMFSLEMSKVEIGAAPPRRQRARGAARDSLRPNQKRAVAPDPPGDQRPLPARHHD